VEPPHPNGAVHDSEPPRRAHTPWEFIILMLFVALIGVGIILAWTLVGSKSPERVDLASANSLSAACNDAQAQLKELPNPSPRTGPDRVARLRAENGVLRTMTSRFNAVRPDASTPAAAVRGWTDDWTKMIDARSRYADDLDAVKNTNNKVQFVTPATGGITPITNKMDDFVRENHPNLDACFTGALQLDVVEGQREYKKVTS